jgi:hypothetical protein
LTAQSGLWVWVQLERRQPLRNGRTSKVPGQFSRLNLPEAGLSQAKGVGHVPAILLRPRGDLAGASSASVTAKTKTD